jgi:hypothetical protein
MPFGAPSTPSFVENLPSGSIRPAAVLPVQPGNVRGRTESRHRRDAWPDPWGEFVEGFGAARVSDEDGNVLGGENRAERPAH